VCVCVGGGGVLKYRLRFPHNASSAHPCWHEALKHSPSQLAEPIIGTQQAIGDAALRPAQLLRQSDASLNHDQ